MQASNRAVLTAVLATLVAVAAFAVDVAVAGRDGVLLTVLAGLLALLFGYGWPVLCALPNRPGSTVVVMVGGVGAALAVFRTEGEPLLRDLPVVFAFTVLLAFVAELIRRDGRERLVESVAGTVTGALVAACVAGWVATVRIPGGQSLVIAGALALAIGSAVAALPFAGWLGAGVTTGAALAAGLVAGALLPDIDLLSGALLGLAVGILVGASFELFDRLPALGRRPAALAAGVLPVSVTGILVYVVGRVLVG
ncbi:hypothetical protein [Cellulomonas hominis]